MPLSAEGSIPPCSMGESNSNSVVAKKRELKLDLQVDVGITIENRVSTLPKVDMAENEVMKTEYLDTCLKRASSP